ncbi:hypothetical protein OR1_02826 [Geobacter sp. OR-1]|uniref:glycosyltransferase family 39 protein n=1 Tax=Geobacter sp. OR-1 TaxID=1266765 RepID=UPI00054324CB|nr:glycosyltransferase family 39 protein [Geobacter sp. OR-1]GAM10537.1 hypothetical protein OR1_02826 [Geobacter sp. OR-1]
MKIAKRISLPLLLLMFFGLSFSAGLRESPTIDEFRHISTGVYYWQSGDFSFDRATPPLWKLAFSLPAHLVGAQPLHPPVQDGSYPGWDGWLMATDFMKANPGNYSFFVTAARSVNLLAATLCLVYLYRRARQSFGHDAALFGTAFLAFSPTLLAHSHYATTDVIAALTLTVLVFQMIDQVISPTWFRLVSIAAMFAVSFLCKFTATILLPPLLLVICTGAPTLGEKLPNRTGIPVGRGARSLASLLLSLLAAVLVVLVLFNAMYGFKGAGYRLNELELKSRSLHSLSLTPVGNLPLPLPKELVLGFDHQKGDSDNAEFPAFFHGRWSPNGFWFYYAVAFCLKETVPFVLMFLLVFLVRSGAGVHPPDRKEGLLLWYLPATLFIVLSFMNRLDIGVRYLLPAYPFICYFYSRVFAASAGRRTLRLALLGLLAFHCLSVLARAPHYTAYFNELVAGPKNGYKYLIDSNLDWGQDLPALKQYMRENRIESIQLAYFGHAFPEFYGINYEPLLDLPKPGYVAVSATFLQGLPYLMTYLDPPYSLDYDYYAFMRQYEPIAQVGHSIMIYRIN